MSQKISVALSDNELFGNEAAEEENPQVLASYFVEKPSFRRFYDPRRRLAIVRARKGMGKSALLAKVAHDVREQHPDALVILLHGADLVDLADFSSDDPLTLINRWQQAICRRVNMEIGSRLRFAASDTEMMMVETAELVGLKGKNLLGALMDRFRFPVGPINFERPTTPDASSLLRAYSAKRSDLKIWLLVDDIDATYPDSPRHRLRTSTFFSAARKIITDFAGISLRGSVRMDVWTSIARSDEAMDKCEQYVTDLTWSQRESARILAKKILAWIVRVAPESVIARHWSVEKNSRELFDLVFLRDLEWGGDRLPPERLFHILSAGRPRWSAQLGRLSGEEAESRGATKIGIDHIEAVLQSFGKLRTDDLYREHKHQYADILGIEAFAGGGSIYYTPALLERIWEKYIVRIGGLQELPRLEGAVVKRPLDLAHFLYKVGFILARVREAEERVSFVKYEERPELLATVVNPDDRHRWDIHPSYRKHLRIKRGSALDQSSVLER